LTLWRIKFSFVHGRYLSLSKGGPESLGIKGAVLALVERWRPPGETVIFLL